MKFLLGFEVSVTVFSELQSYCNIWGRGGESKRDLKDRDRASTK